MKTVIKVLKASKVTSVSKVLQDLVVKVYKDIKVSKAISVFRVSQDKVRRVFKVHRLLKVSKVKEVSKVLKVHRDLVLKVELTTYKTFTILDYKILLYSWLCSKVVIHLDHFWVQQVRIQTVNQTSSILVM